jgi:hypothetical protein
MLMIGSIPSARTAFARQSPDSLVPRMVVRATTNSLPDRKPDEKVTLHVYNYARIDHALLARSEQVTAAIFENVGVEIVWVDGPLSQAQSWACPACQSDMGTTDFVVKILPRHMAMRLQSLHTTREALGFARPCPENEPACELTVFYHRVDGLMASKGYRADFVLGHVIAHELGHVLIGPGHSEEGIMRGNWSDDELQRISLGRLLEFTNDQSSRLRSTVLRRMMQN